MASSSNYRPLQTLIVFCLVVLGLLGLMALTGSWVPRLGLDLRGGTTITLTARAQDGGTVPRENLEMARTIIQSRVDSMGVGESSVTVQGNDKIEVAVPNVDSEELVRLVGSTARLSFPGDRGATHPKRHACSERDHRLSGYHRDSCGFARRGERHCRTD